MELYRLFQIAYKKLKSYAYYDKSQLILANKIAEFETINDIEKNLKALSRSFSKEQLRNEILKKCLDSVSILTFPKTVK